MKALFGGTFDPIHEGHLHLARQAVSALRAQSLVFLPAGQNPLKTNHPIASNAHRLKMLHASIQDSPEQFEVSELETDRIGPSYTVDTLEQLPKGEWTLLMGSEVFESLPQWKNPKRILELAQIAVITRPGIAPPDPGKTLSALGAKTARVKVLQLDLLPYSSTEIREHLKALSPKQWESDPSPIPGLQRAVWQIIKENRLYSR